MAVVVMSLDKWAREQRRLAKNFMPTVLKGMRSGGMRALPILEKATRNAKPASAHGAIGAVNTGDYLRRWKSSPIPHGVRIFNDAPQAAVIEFGRRPGKMPDLKAIQRWAQRRLQLSLEEAKSAAYPIARAIARRGLRPRRVLGGSEAVIGRVIFEEVDRALTRVMRGEAV